MEELEPRRDGPYEAPLERLAAGRGQRRRAIVAILAIGLAVGGAIGVARLGDGPNGTSDTARASADRPSTAPSAADRPSSGPRTEHLLDAPNDALAGAPSVILLEEHGRDIQLVRWIPGGDVSPDRTFHAALSAGATDVFTVLAPADDHLLVLEPGASGTSTGDRGRLVDRAGRVLWTADHLVGISGAAWSADGRLVVVTGSNRRWHLVRIDDHGNATDRPVALPFRIFLPTPLPTTDLSIPRDDPRTLPLGFSADGRWVYGGIASPELGILVATFRVAVDGSRVQPVSYLDVGRPDGLAPAPGTIGGRIVDPLTGRIATLRVNANTSEGPPTLEVRNPDAGFVFSVSGETPVGSGWGTEGGLYVLSANAPLFADRVRLVRYGSDGTAGPPLLELGPLTGSSLLGVEAGYAVLAASATRPENAIQLIAVDLADPTRVSAIRLPGSGSDPIVGVELRG